MKGVSSSLAFSDHRINSLIFMNEFIQMEAISSDFIAFVNMSVAHKRGGLFESVAN